MTARPSGAFCSPPSPRPRLIGIMPRIMASAVISTGRRRVVPAESAASSAPTPSRRWSLAKVTSKMEFDVATPMHMIVPIRLGTLKVVRVAKSIHRIPENAPGRPVRMIIGSSQLWKLTTIRKYTRATAKTMPSPSRVNAVFMLCTWPCTSMVEAFGSLDGGSLNHASGSIFRPHSGTISLYHGCLGAYSWTMACTSPDTPPRSRSWALTYTSKVGWRL